MLDRFRLIVAATIVVMWVVSNFIDLVSPTYDPPQSVNVLMTLVAGWLFTTGVLGKARRSNGEEDD